jgi:hypothetical protein
VNNLARSFNWIRELACPTINSPCSLVSELACQPVAILTILAFPHAKNNRRKGLSRTMIKYIATHNPIWYQRKLNIWTIIMDSHLKRRGRATASNATIIGQTYQMFLK